ncbi:glycoside hydrolase family 127 protein [Chitinophaga eiseniae]|uniref:Glycoside hydrolase family 127 protein n=1 Tax=Chitinophaga eiseniae TaxID=634771 RepID=A0A847SVA5_9BACT|nr:glycoside hydrolase family 127 protein [Chitinophaga eiseniae]NLR80672.1 glycoside hydrolase family 127 protein [Chitinophaga eiseniae]
MKRLIIPCLLLAGGLQSHYSVQAQSYVPGWKESKMKVLPAVDIKAYPFPISDVTLSDGPFKTAMLADAHYLLKIDPDRLLSAFRSNAGLEPKGKQYGGWETGGLAGHTMGHYLSACAMQYAATKDTAYLNRVNYLVSELAICQDKRQNGYIGAFPNDNKLWSEIAAGDIRSRGFDLNGGWSPWYTVHKIMAGLLDAWLYCDNATALKVNKRLADWTGHIIKNLSEEQMQKMLICEYGGMAETLTNTYALSGDKKYLDLSYRFYDKRILDSLAIGRDILPGKHSNTQIPKAIASIRRYELNKDAKDAAIAKYFWEVVTRDHSYANGGNSNYEYFGPARHLNDALTDNTTETCNTYNMLKLTRHLFALSPQARLMDYYEKALYNHILASQNHETGMMCYFVPLRMGGHKEYSDEFETFTCCVGSGMENHVKYGESIYYRGEDGSLYVNLFIPSVLNWKEKGITVTQTTSLPADNRVTLTVSTRKTSAFTLRIRKPAWARPGISLQVNGQQVPLTTDESGYFTITRTWKNNDRVLLTLPADVYTEAMPDNPNRQALFYGPVLLSGILGEKEPDPVSGVPVLVTANQTPDTWIKRADSRELSFRSAGTGQPQDVTLVPFNTTRNEYYTVYWDVFSPDSWKQQQAVYAAEKKKQQELDARTTDILRPGEMQPERDHNFTGEKTTTEEEHGRKWRIAWPEGYFAFTMKVDPQAAHTLQCTYWGMDNRGRTFDIVVDGTTIATEDINKYKGSRFYDISYPIPAHLTQGKQQVQIRFVPKANNSAGPLYGCRMIKD